MNQLLASSLLAAIFSAIASPAMAADQTVPGAGNDAADRTAAGSPRVQQAHRFLVEQAHDIKNLDLRAATLDLLQNRRFCITSRVGVDDARKAQILAALAAAGLLNPADDATFPGELKADVFPPCSVRAPIARRGQ